MFSEIEQEEIINEFLNTIEINDIIRSIHSNIQKCKKCKFNNVNIQLYKTHLPQNIVKNICKYNYVECQKCKMLKNLKEYVNENTVKSSKGFQTIITNIEKDEEPPQAYYKQQNIEEYFFVKKRRFPTYKHIQNKLLYNDTDKEFYTKEIHNRIKKSYDEYYNGHLKSICCGVDDGDCLIYENVEVKDIQIYKEIMLEEFVMEYDKNTLGKDKNRRDCFKYFRGKMDTLMNIIKLIMNYINWDFNYLKNPSSKLLTEAGHRISKKFEQGVEIPETLQNKVFNAYPSIKDIKKDDKQLTEQKAKKQEELKQFLNSTSDFE